MEAQKSANNSLISRFAALQIGHAVVCNTLECHRAVINIRG